MRPICYPEQDIVSRREENNERGQSECHISGTVKDIACDLFPLGCVPRVGLLRLVIDGGQEDIEHEEHYDVETLADGRSVTKQVRKWADLVRANDAWVDKVRPDLVNDAGYVRHVAQPCEHYRGTEPGDE